MGHGGSKVSPGMTFTARSLRDLALKKASGRDFPPGTLDPPSGPESGLDPTKNTPKTALLPLGVILGLQTLDPTRIRGPSDPGSWPDLGFILGLPIREPRTEVGSGTGSGLEIGPSGHGKGPILALFLPPKHIYFIHKIGVFWSFLAIFGHFWPFLAKNGQKRSKLAKVPFSSMEVGLNFDLKGRDLDRDHA